MNSIVTFDAAEIDTPAGLTPTVAQDQITGIPVTGTGLAGAAFVPGTSIWNTQKAAEAAEGDPVVTFTSSALSYGAQKSDTSIAEFLGDDAASIAGAGGNLEMGPSALIFSGFVYIPPGVHEVTIRSDDGFEMKLGGVDFSEFASTRASEETSRVAEFDGGLYELELLYFDGGGRMSLSMEIDGLPVNQSAFYMDPGDVTNPAASIATVPVEDYHPSYFLGPDSLDTPVTTPTTEMRDVIDGAGADDLIDGLGGDDEITGGYGDDILLGGQGDDVLDGGRGSDVLDGGDGNDILVSRSDTGEQRIGQVALGNETRPDPDNEVDPVTQKLYAYNGQPLVGDDVLIGGAGADTFLIAPQINAKLDIVEQHVKADGSINWAGVAGENDELHDHWVDHSGIDIIADFNALEDHIAVIGHTAVPYVTYANVMGDEALESIITVMSVQHGNGGAHDMDLIGQVIVHGDLVDVDDIQTDDMVTYGMVDTFADIAEALVPIGEEKLTTVGSETIKGYDTREPSTMDMHMHGHGGPGTNVLGAVTGDPYGAFDNDNFDESMLASGGGESDEMPPTRAPFEPLGIVDGAGETVTGTGAGETWAPTGAPDPEGLPGALGFWSFDGGVDGAHSDETQGDGGSVKAYTLWENQALINSDSVTEGPRGPGSEAMYFNGEDSFAYLAHDPAMNITQGTIAMWVRPDDLGEKSMFVTKDQSGSGEGGHFRLGHTDEGGLFLRMAEGDGGKNHAWETGSLLQEGDWQHLAVNFTSQGVTVYLDGQAVGNNAWTAVDGNVATPGAFREAYLLANDEPWVFGADQYIAKLNDTAQEFATDREDLVNEYEGGLAEFGVWGGYTPDDVLTLSEINALMNDGPGAALTNPAGSQPMVAGDDVVDGAGGNDMIDGGAGDDELAGGAGNDTVTGGYGNDYVQGGSGNDVLDGGWGSDLVVGGDGDDIILSRSDVGEDRAGQLVLDDPSRPSQSIDEVYLKLFDWVDQPLVGDDVLVGGDGKDTFQFETLINGTRESILDNTMSDGRMIHWHGVAGENKYVHDHWVDGIGIDVIADYVAADDTISIKGHTTNVDVSYATVDTDGDSIDDDMVSIITVYSQQGNGGGAHDEDYLGYVVVHGDKVEQDAIITDPAVHYGVVDTIDDLQEAFAPTGDTKWTEFDGEMHLGYDTRDVNGDPMGSDPEAYSSNPWLNAGEVTFASSVPDDIEQPTVLMSHGGGMFGGGDQPIEIPHTSAQAAAEGTLAFSFVAYNPGNDQNQALFSKDHSGFKDGGHLTAFISSNGVLKVRFQSEEDETYLYDWGTRIEAGEEYHMAFTFDSDQLKLYLNGEQIAEGDGFSDGMLGNLEDAVLGAATRTRNGDDDNLTWHFDGEIENVLMLDRAITDTEAVFLSEADGDFDALNPLYGIVDSSGSSDDTGTGPGDETGADDTADAPAGDETEAEPDENTGAGPDGNAESQDDDQTGTVPDDDPLDETETGSDDDTGTGADEDTDTEQNDPVDPVDPVADDVPEEPEDPVVPQPDEETDTQPDDDGQTDDTGSEDQQEQDTSASEDDSDDDVVDTLSELVSRIVEMILGFFGSSGAGSTGAAPAPEAEDVEQVEDLLSTLIPQLDFDENARPAIEDDEEEFDGTPMLL